MANSLDLILAQPYLEGRGGAERVVLKIAHHFNAPIYTMGHSGKSCYDEFRELDIRIVKPGILSGIAGAASSFDRDSRSGRLARAGPSFFGFEVKESYDAISAHLPPSEWLRNKNERVCWYCHGPNAGFRSGETLLQASLAGRNAAETALFYAGTAVFRAMEQRMVAKLEKICTCSEITAKKIGASFGRFDAQPVYPSVDIRSFSCNAFQKYFLCLSRIIPGKGISHAIDAFRIFSREKKGWRLIVAGSLLGDQRSKNYLAGLEKAAAGLDVQFAINIPDARAKELYSNCRALLFPSEDEDWGLVPLEAMASSKPVIANNRGGPTISVVDGKTGFLVNSPKDMAGRMLQLAEDQSLAEKMGKAGRKRVEQSYTWEIFLDKMEKTFKETAKAKEN